MAQWRDLDTDNLHKPGLSWLKDKARPFRKETPDAPVVVPNKADLSQVIHSNPISMPGAQPEFWSQNQRIEEAIAAHGQHWTYDLYSSVEKSSLTILNQRSPSEF